MQPREPCNSDVSDREWKILRPSWLIHFCRLAKDNEVKTERC